MYRTPYIVSKSVLYTAYSVKKCLLDSLSVLSEVAAVEILKDVQALCAFEDVHCVHILAAVERGVLAKLRAPLRRVKSWVRCQSRATKTI